MLPVLIPQLLTALLGLGLGVFVWLRSPRSRAHQVFLLFYCSLAMWLGGQAIGVPYQGDREGAELISRLIYIGVPLIPTAIYHLVIRLYNIQPGFPSIPFAYSVAAIVMGLAWTTDWIVGGVHQYSWGYFTAAGRLHPIFLIWFAALCLKATYLLVGVQRNKALPANTRNQAAYFLTGLFIGTLGTYDYLPEYGFDLQPKGFLFEIVFLCLTAYAIMKHRLLDISVVIRRTAVYSILAALITASYLVVVLLAEKIFQGFLGYKSLMANMMVGFAIALGFNPLRDVVQRLIDRWFFTKSTPALAAENERLRHEVAQSDRLKAVATLAAGMAHEIKNPLSSIKTFAAYLPQKYDDPQFRDRFTKIMTQEVDKMNTLVHRLLEFARPAEPELKPVSLKRVIEETLDLLQGTLLNNQIQTQTSFDPTDTIYADEGQIKQALLNVVLNSIEAMPGPGRITVSTVRQNGSLAIVVADTGPGIARKDVQRIFDPFYTTKAGGTGLGLSVVHSIVRQHGGRVAVESEIGKGTTVRMTLPVQQGGQHGAAAHSHCR